MIFLDSSQETQKKLATYVANKNGLSFEEFTGGYPFFAMGFLISGKFKGAVVYNGFVWPDIIGHMAGETGWLTRSHLKHIFTYPFEQLNCSRITAHIDRKNKLSRSITQRMGFKLEGMKKKALPNGHDQMIYGLLKKDCRWIDGKKSSKCS